MELAAHAESLGVDAIAAIPPIYFKLPEHSIAKYWNDISSAAPNTDFIIYNIPQLAGTALTLPLLREMLKNPKVVGVKNSSLPAMDIQMFKYEGTLGGRDFVVFNGPDEQFVSGFAIGADGGIYCLLQLKKRQCQQFQCLIVTHGQMQFSADFLLKVSTYHIFPVKK